MSATVRSVNISDAPRLLEIYSYYVTHTAISFEYDVPTLAEFEGRITKTLQKYPYLAVEEDGVVYGYAYAGAFVGRAAYCRCCELTVYLHKDARKKGYGRMLYTELEKRLRADGFLNLYACIGYTDTEDEYLTNNSEEFHAHMGFKTVGRFYKCGSKFGRWYDMIWMEKLIGEHK